MQNRHYREDDREALTNEGIKADLKKDAISQLVASVLVILAILLLDFCAFGLLRSLSEYPLALWLLAILFFVISLSGIWVVVVNIKIAITYINAIYRDRFFVTADKLIDKKEGRRSPKGSSLYRSLRTKPNGYYFASGTYEVPVETPHYCRSKKFAMNGTTLFRRSDCGDSFLLVSLKAGKPIKIYPEDLFDYRDSSPL